MSIEIYPVIHVKDEVQALEQAEMAHELGVDGLYLIDHGGASTKRLIDAYNAVESKYPDRFIGVNLLQIGAGSVSLEFLHDLAEHDEIRRLPDALWVDNAAVMSERMTELRQNEPKLRRVKYLGGVAFKYTELYTDNPSSAALQARMLSSLVDVVTTSGPATGEMASVAKIAAMKKAIAPQRLALASGVDSHNIHLFGPHLDEALVATSIETAPYSGIFRESKLRDLLSLARYA